MTRRQKGIKKGRRDDRFKNERRIPTFKILTNHTLIITREKKLQISGNMSLKLKRQN